MKKHRRNNNIRPEKAGYSENETRDRNRVGDRLARKLGLEGQPDHLLVTALTHPSFLFENPDSGKENNQRLEFLGDAILDFIVGEYLYLNYPEKPEGELTKMRAAVVNESTLAQKAREIELGTELLLGRGEQASGGRERPSILADAWEAVIGAIYLKYGLAEARRIIINLLKPAIEEVAKGNYGDYKTMLQEKVQRVEQEVSYRILAEDGPDHCKEFTAGVYINRKLMATGSGRTKKEAEQQAAQQVLEQWGRESNGR